VGLVWFCGEKRLEEDLGDFMGFDKFVIWSWSGKLSWKGVWCNSRKEGIVWKCICIYVLFQWKMVEKPSCVLCKFILLKTRKVA